MSHGNRRSVSLFEFCSTSASSAVRPHADATERAARIAARMYDVSTLLLSGRGLAHTCAKRLVSWASPPEFGELLGTGSALVVTRLSSGRAQRQIHRIGAEHMRGAAVREDRLD